MIPFLSESWAPGGVWVCGHTVAILEGFLSELIGFRNHLHYSGEALCCADFLSAFPERHGILIPHEFSSVTVLLNIHPPSDILK
jgi:hypothetical protein